MLRAKHMGFKSVRRVEVKAETTTPGEARGGAVDAASARAGASRGRRTLPRLEFTVDEDGAVLHGPQRGAYPFLGASGDAERELAASFRALHMREVPDENERDNGGSTAAVDGDQEEEEDNQEEEEGEEEAERKPAPMKECILNDTRATTLAIKYDRGVGKFVCGSSIERFSGHTGVCRVLGSKKYPIIPHSLRIGDLLRIGSVGLVVCEINRTASEETLEALSEEEYEFLKENYLSLPLQQTFHPTDSRGAQMDDDDDRADDKDDCARTRRVGGETSDEGESEEDARAGRDSAGADGQGGGTKDGSRTMGVAGVAGKRFCYICYDGDEEPEENPLVAPCDCKGDTKYVHLECLQRWNNNLDAEGNNPNQKVCAVTNTDGLDVCSICKATYLTSVRLDDGRVVSLLAKKLPPPYVTFAVVTQHETRNRSTALTNTRFQLSFANLPRGQQYLTIGRSTTNNMTLRYRTVSQLHAKIKFQDGHFFLFDASSSNGTMLFLSKPLELDWNKTMHVKIGRTILTLKSKKKWKWTGASEDDADSDGEGVSSPRPSGAGTPREGGESTPRASAFRAPTPRHPGQNRFEPDGILSDPSAELLSPFRGMPITLPVEPLTSDIQDGSEDSPTAEAPATLVHSPQVRTAPLVDDPELPESFNLSEIDDDVQNASTSDSHPAEDNQQQQQSTSYRAFMPGNPRASPPEAPGLNGGGTPLGLLQGRVADLPRMRNELRQRREHMLFDLVDSLALIDSLERMPMRRPTASTRAVAPPRRLPHARRPSSASRPEQQQ